jgi:iron complex outermembrane receptor protein
MMGGAVISKYTKVARGEHAFWIGLALGVACVPVTGSAQSTSAETDQTSATGVAASSQNLVNGQEIENVIVTAQKRAANIQDVPLSVAAIDGAALENSGIEDVSDIARRTPGVAVSTTGPGRTQIIIRGVSSVTGSQATTGVYQDEVPISALSTNIDGSLFDLNRVEVLRGPQGTLYGSASMGGAIKYVSNQPDSTTTEARGELTLSSTESGGTNYAANGVVNVPLSRDVAALRVATFYKSEEGYIDRYAIDPSNYLGLDPTVAPKKDVNSYDLWGVRAAVSLTPTDSLTLTPSVYYQTLNQDGAFSFDDPPGSYGNMVQGRLFPDTAEDTVSIYNLTAQLKINDDLDLTSSTSFFRRDFEDTEDTSRVIFYLSDLYFSGIQPIAFPHAESQELVTKTFTQELRLGGQIGSVDFVVGAYYQKNEPNRHNELPLTAEYNQAFGTPFPEFDTLFRGHTLTTSKELAGFGQATWAIIDRLRVTAGLRYFEVEQEFSASADGVFNGGHSESRGKSKGSGVTPKVAVDFDIDDDLLLYASAAKGFRAGGALNPVPEAVCGTYLGELGLSSAPTKYDPDSLWSYELGLKSQFAQRRLTVNTAAYYIDWSEIQQQVNLQCGFNFTGNFGSAISRGFELETRWRATGDLTLGVNAGYTDAYLSDTVEGTPGQKGDRLLNVPEWTASAVVEYERPVFGKLLGFVMGDYSYASDVLAEYDDTSPWRERKDYDIVNLRIGVRDADERWRVSLFADNLLDTHASVGNAFSTTAVVIPTTRSLAVNRPRTIGLNLQLGF